MLDRVVKSDGSDKFAQIARRMMPYGAVQIFAWGDGRFTATCAAKQSCRKF